VSMFACWLRPRIVCGLCVVVKLVVAALLMSKVAEQRTIVNQIYCWSMVRQPLCSPLELHK
jgi:hypothetical protein